MLKKFSFILICVSVLIIQGHDVVVHHHDFLHHEENDRNEAGHNLFSYVDIAEEFTLQSQPDLSISACDLFLCSNIEIVPVEKTIQNFFIHKNEDSPPDPKISFKSLRAPPIHFIC